MPECRNCGAFVTSDYVRVRSLSDEPGVAACPQCEDRIWGRDGKPRPAKSNRDTGAEPATYDPAADPTTDVATDGGQTSE
jgi:hypothetical protein